MTNVTIKKILHEMKARKVTSDYYDYEEAICREELKSQIKSYALITGRKIA